MNKVRIALCQINPTVGDIKGNTERIIDHIKKLDHLDPDIIAFPELAVTGYPPEDLLYKPHFIAENISAIDCIARATGNAVVIAGFVDKKDSLYNAAAIMQRGLLLDIYHKIHLPNYGVFDEMRYFSPGIRYPVYSSGRLKFGVSICEDVWFQNGPVSIQAANGADIIININASPYHIGKPAERLAILKARVTENSIPIAYLNIVGGQDELVFDGHSLILNEKGEIIAEGRRFSEDIIVFDLNIGAQPQENKAVSNACLQYHSELINLGDSKIQDKKEILEKRGPISKIETPDNEEYIYEALVLGTRDYVKKNGFSRVCIGLSGGIDSAIVATIAVDAVGKESVTCIFMPSPYTSGDSRIDAYGLAQNLGVEILEIPIASVFEAYLKTLKPEFGDVPAGIAEENLQARIRGNYLMALSNNFGWLVLTTGNKSEMSVGYATLYGDMAGGFAPIKDVPKTLVYKLCEWKNKAAGMSIIPESILTKEPTAELRPGQKDTDSLPPYEILDPILKAYIEDFRSYEDIAALGFDSESVKKVIYLVDKSEYKRRQSPPGIKITPRAFGRDRRFPVTNKYRSW
jgi:NAD+ synthase (glutamine-hydrolysing)